jgi:hypothetical protein
MRRLVVAVAVVTVSCCGGTIGDDASTTVDRPSTTVFETTTSVNATTGDLVGRCGTVVFPLSDPVVLPNQALDDELLAVVESTFEESGIGDYEWFLAEQSDDAVFAFGRVTSDGASSYADARLELRDGTWTVVEWGECHLEVSSPGYGNARWMLDPYSEPDPVSSSLAIQINEQACASGEAPVGREVLPVVVPEVDRVTITVLVVSQTTSSTLTCPGNPWFPVVVDLGAPWDGRALFDGSTVPAEPRSWPPDVPPDFES